MQIILDAIDKAHLPLNPAEMIEKRDHHEIIASVTRWKEETMQAGHLVGVVFSETKNEKLIRYLEERGAKRKNLQAE